MVAHRRLLLCATFLAGTLGAAVLPAGATAVAQTAPPPPPETTTAAAATAESATGQDEVVVTGSRIRKPNLESNNPLTSLNQRDIEISGITDVAQLLQRQPQVGIGNNTQTTTNSIRNQGIETISLRNLGTQRTLTLINGHRQVGGGVGSSAVDTRTISTQNLTGVDIVTGGSSALYGADAVAGVINYRTRQDLEGVLVQGQYGDSEHGGGANYSGAITVGHNFLDNRGNISFTASYNQNDPVYRSQRDYATSYLSAVPNPARSTQVGALNAPAFIAVPNVFSNVYNNSSAPVIVTALGAANPAYSYTFNANGGLQRFDRGTVLRNNLGTAQTQSINCDSCFRDTLSLLSVSQQNNGIESFGHYDFLRDRGFIRSATAYYEFKYYHLIGFSQSSTGTFAGSSIAYNNNPSQATNGLPSAGAAYPVFLDNAYIPADLSALIKSVPATSLPSYQAKAGSPRVLYVTRIDNDFGDREYKQHNDMGEAVAGIRGEFTNGWHFDTFLNYGETDATAISVDRDQVKWFQQIDAVTNPANGQVVCRSTLTNPGNGCIPINIFAPGSNSQAAKAYSYLQTKEHDSIQLWNYQANLTGTLFHMRSLFSGADLPVAFATGFEYRREASDTNPDRLNQIGEVFGNVVQRTKGSYSTREGYAELDVPVLANVPFAKRIDIDASARFQDYTTTGGDWTYGANGNWAINDSFKFRGAYSKAVRSPNISELYAAGSVSYAAIADPCDQNNVNLGTQAANRLANCRTLLGALAGTGSAYTFVQSPATKATITTGNPNLDPERATTWTGGIVFTPTSLRRFSLTLDYYDIKIKGAIASIGTSTIANNCVDSASLNNQFCGLTQRGPDGNITLINSQVFNVASFKTKGVDFGFSYSVVPAELGLRDLGTFTLNANANYLSTLLYNPVAGDQTTRDQGAGELAYDAPRFQGNARVTWDFHNITLSWATRYLGEINRSNQDKLLDYSYERIPEFYIHDLRGEFRFQRYVVFAGINNVTDNNPPYTPSTYIPTGTGALYDALGRFYYAGFKAQF